MKKRCSINKVTKLVVIWIIALMSVFILKESSYAAPTDMSGTNSLSSNYTGGIRLVGTTTLNITTSITIGSTSCGCPGIDLNGYNLTLNVSSGYTLTVRGGYYTDSSYSDRINCAAIYVPTNSTLTINGAGTINAYGYTNTQGNGAGIGGNGIVIANINSSTAKTNSGTINISSGTVNAYGGYASSTMYGTGAGIGGGGIYNNYKTSVTGGNVKSITINGSAKVTAYGGYSSSSYDVYGTGAGIGCGGIYNQKATTTKGGDCETVTISTSGTVNTYGGYSSSYNVYGSGSGIGGGGIYDTMATNIRGGNAITVTISSATVNAIAGYSNSTSSSYKASGLGAGIGGGGIYTTKNEILEGGMLKNLKISSGTVTATGGYGSVTNACGAGIGGGGIYTTSTSSTKQIGGYAENLRITGGTIKAYGGYAKDTFELYGAGAGIGGGGIYNTYADVTNQIGGCLYLLGVGGESGTSLTVKGGYCNTSSTLYYVHGGGAGIGGGGIYNQSTVANPKAGTLTKCNIGNSNVTIETSLSYHGQGANKGSGAIFNGGTGFISNGIEGLEETTITSNTSISSSNTNGLYISTSCTLTFPNTITEELTFGSTLNKWPGIDIAEGITLTIDNQSQYPINIYGGTRTDVGSGDVIKYAGIRVPTSSTVVLQGTGTINSYGMGGEKGTGAGIGGNGMIVGRSDSITLQANGGNITLQGGVINANGGFAEEDGYGLGAGIGGGGIYNEYKPSITDGIVNTITISDSAVVNALGGCSGSENNIYGSGAGIGGGGIYNNCSSTVNGGYLNNITITATETITATGGYGNAVQGSGAGIGGGGIYNLGSSNVTGGYIGTITINSGNIEGIGGYGNIAEGSGAGIGGGGVKTVSGSTAAGGRINTITIKDGTVTATGGRGNTVQGSGAGIGGGGLYNMSSGSTTETGGYISTIDILGGEIEAIGGYSEGDYEVNGLGAGIGGGGICNENSTNVTNQTGGYISTLRIKGGIVTATAGYRDVTDAENYGYGLGAGIGGGGISNKVTVSSSYIYRGKITYKYIYDYSKVTPSKGAGEKVTYTGGDIGGGGVYNNNTTGSSDGYECFIKEDCAIKEAIPSGVYIGADCTVTFTNTSAITIGDYSNYMPAIELADDIEANINNESSYTITLKGGTFTDTSNNVYNFAGIHVPSSSTLNIGGTGTWDIYGRNSANGSGAGIGGNGIVVGNINCTTDCLNAGNINITGGTITSRGGDYNTTRYGLGAGIGGGGIYNGYLNEIQGGYLNGITISGSATVTAYGGYTTGSYVIYGTGAGIGGGGIYNTTATEIIGGYLKDADISTSGTVTVEGGRTGSTYTYGTGAGIGGGGVYNTASATIQGGYLETIEISSGTIKAKGGYNAGSYEIDGTGAGIGSGGIYNTGTGTITGGNVGTVNITGTAYIQYAYGGHTTSSNNVYGTGAGIGSGGIWNNNATSVTVGDLEEINISTSSTVITNGGYSQSGNIYGTGAGIGTGGIYNTKAATIKGGDLKEIKIESGTITSKGGYAYYNVYGSGAGIGSGAIWNNASSTITGGNIEKISIEGGTISEATGGYSSYTSSSYYVDAGGAGIGSGGIYTSSGTVFEVGGIKEAKMSGGTITAAKGGYAYYVRGSGAGIGGGGLYNTSTSTTKQTGGFIDSIEISKGTVKSYGGYSTYQWIYGSGAGIGGGGIYSTASGTLQGGYLKDIKVSGEAKLEEIKGGCNWNKYSYNNYGSGAGIGGGGIYNTVATIVKGGYLKNLEISTSSEVKAEGGYTGSSTVCGSGAGIGGGGIYNTASATLQGGYVENVNISEGVITATGGYNTSTMQGSGAGIGGGGIYTNSGSKIDGGYIDKVVISGGTINCYGGYGNTNYGSGAGIGGGGIYDIASSSRTQIGGYLKDILIHDGNIKVYGGELKSSDGYGSGAGIGGGGIYDYYNSGITKQVGGYILTAGIKGTVTARGGCCPTNSYYTYGSGAGIGGGGIGNRQTITASYVVSGKLNRIYTDSSGITIEKNSYPNYFYGKGAEIGTGGLYNGSTNATYMIKGTEKACSTVVDDDYTIKESKTVGLYVIKDSTITFSNEIVEDVQIGSIYTEYPGIEVAEGVTATIVNNSEYPINIYGGTFRDEINSNIYNYAGIYVPNGATLNIDGTGIMNVYGYDKNNGTGAGIGGNGLIVGDKVTTGTEDRLFKNVNAGKIKIKGSTVNAYGGSQEADKKGTGAGIGGGGVYNSYMAEITGGDVENVTITTPQKVLAEGGHGTTIYGSGAGIGGGGIYNTYSSVTNIRGGNAGKIIILRGDVTAKGGYANGNYNCYGLGAGIGGGGLSNSVTIASNKIQRGNLIYKNLIGYDDITAIKGTGNDLSLVNYTGANIGSGGVYNNESGHLEGEEDSIVLEDNISIDKSITSGLYIPIDCTLTFPNTIEQSITIGSVDNASPGIHIVDGVTLTIINNSSYPINIYGGEYEEINGDINKCAGIYVPSNAILNISGSGTINSYGNGNGNGTGAGIGGNGIVISSVNSSSANANAGSINISGGVVNTYGGSNNGEVKGTGAGIGSGGIYNDMLENVVGGVLKSIEITEDGEVLAYGGSSSGEHNIYGSGAGIGGGGIYTIGATDITEGYVKQLNFETTGLITTKGGSSTTNDVYGSGAGIGSGGIYNETEDVEITMMQIESLEIVRDGAINKIIVTRGTGNATNGQGAKVGTGGLYNFETATNGVEFDGEGPEVEGYYNGTKIKVKAEDTSIGLWKVTDENDELIAVFSGVSDSILTDSELTKVKVYNAIGTSVEYNLVYDNTEPIVRNVYKNENGTMFKMTATDDEKLGIVTYADDSFIKDITSLDDTGTTNFETTEGTTQFVVYDDRVSKKIVPASEILIDENPPEVVGEITYYRGKYTITIKDDESGLWKITDSTGDIEYVDFSKKEESEEEEVTP